MQKNAVKFSPLMYEKIEMGRPFGPYPKGGTDAPYLLNNCSACATESGLPTSMNREPL
jgi:hypothetical protein